MSLVKIILIDKSDHFSHKKIDKENQKVVFIVTGCQKFWGDLAQKRCNNCVTRI